MGLLDRARRSLSPENPSTSLSNPAPWLFEALGGQPTSSGIQVNEVSALRNSAVYACNKILSESLAVCPCKVGEEDDRGYWHRRRDLREYALLRRQPNADMSAFNFFVSMMLGLGLWGNGYAEVQYDRSFRVTSIWPKSPGKTFPERQGGVLRYRTTDTDGGHPRDIHAEDMLHFRDLSLDGIVGISPIRQIRDEIGAMVAANRSRGKFFANASRPSGILAPKTPMTKEQREGLVDALRRATAGDNAFGTYALPFDVEWKQMTMTARDSQFAETSQASIGDIARVYQVPLILLAMQGNSHTYASAEQFFLAFAKNTLLPKVRNFEETLNLRLFANDPDLSARFDMREILRGDFLQRSQGFQNMRNAGALTADEWRMEEGMNPMKVGGEDAWRPLNTVVVGQEAAPPDPVQDDPSAQAVNQLQQNKAARAWFQDRAAECVRWTTRDPEKIRRNMRPVLEHIGRGDIVEVIATHLMRGNTAAAESAAFTN